VIVGRLALNAHNNRRTLSSVDRTRRIDQPKSKTTLKANGSSHQVWVHP
jgi:hypothetical protein